MLQREQCHLFSSPLAFSHFLFYSQANWALLELIPRWVGLYIFQDPVSLSNKLSCEAGSFYCRLNPHRFFQSEVLRRYFPTPEPWVAWSVSFLHCSAWFICTLTWGRLLHQLPPCSVLHPLPCHESFPPECPSPFLLPVWMNVSSLTFWLSVFHTVQFSVSLVVFLFLNLLLSFFWLCEETWCIYLCLHLDQKSQI